MQNMYITSALLLLDIPIGIANIFQGYNTDTGAIMRLPHCQCSVPENTDTDIAGIH